MKYFKHFETVNGVSKTLFYRPEDSGVSIPEAEDNSDYARMVSEVDAGASTIEDVDVTYVKTYPDNRIAAYGNIGDQLDMQYHDAVDGTATWQDHVAAVKAAHPKP